MTLVLSAALRIPPRGHSCPDIVQSMNHVPGQYTSPLTGFAPQQTPVSNPADQQGVPHVHAAASPSSSASRPTLAQQFRSELYAAGVSARTAEALAEIAARLDAALFDADSLIPLQLTALRQNYTGLVATRLFYNLPDCFKGMPPVNTTDVDEAKRTLNNLEKALRNGKSPQAETVGAIQMIIENLLEYMS